MDAMTMNTMLVELLTFRMKLDSGEGESSAPITFDATFQRDTDASELELMQWFMNELEVTPSALSISPANIYVKYTNDPESTGSKPVFSGDNWQYLQNLAESFMEQVNCISEQVGETLDVDAFTGETMIFIGVGVNQLMKKYVNHNMPVTRDGDFSTFGTHFEAGGVMMLGDVGNSKPMLVANPKGYSVFDADGELVDWINE
ncbi:hypothetical protein [Secundilactobacillus muriivasis]